MSRSSKPSVDVVIPCYKYAHYLEGCVASVLDQRGVDVRILVVDDASPDDTPAVAARLAAADSRITYVRNETNRGLIGSANRGVIDWASADYVLLISADDLLTPGALARAAAALEANPEATFAFGPAIIFSENSDLDLNLADARDAKIDVIDGSEFIRALCRRGNGVPSPTAVVRTSAQKAAGPYNEATRHTSDLEMWIRLAASGPVVALDTPQAWYRWHSANMSIAFTTKPAADAQQRIRAIAEASKACADKAPELPALLDELRRIEADSACWRGSVAIESGALELGKAFLDAARDIDPRIVRSRLWLGAQRRRVMWGPVGRRVLGLLGAHPKYDAASADKLLFPPTTLQRGREWRWWPTPAI
jgi:GT2 family glycosyltransferase